MNTPQTAAELNALIRNHFCVVECSRAYVEFPFSFKVDSEDFTAIKRVVMATVALKGDEALACKQIWETLVACVSRENLLDQSALLLIRAWFVNDEVVTRGRLGFFLDRSQERLVNSRLYAKEGYIPNEVLRERE